MRSAFNRNDASAGARSANQDVMKKYLQDAPWGIGIGIGYENVPANNKYRKLSTIPPDSEYVFVWQHTGIIGITIFIITTIIMLGGACWIVLFKIKSPSLRGIGAGLCCAFVSQQLGGYGNQVLMQFPNCLIIYGGLSLVYALPYMEKEWIAYESVLIAKQEEKKRLRLEKIEKMRVKPWYSRIYKYL
jgi:O-antigen ligase